jgi:hypothetical protein
VVVGVVLGAVLEVGGTLVVVGGIVVVVVVVVVDGTKNGLSKFGGGVICP